MPRVARTAVPGVPHHITQRGNNRQDVFFTDDDRRADLALLGERAAAYGLKILGYCLMTNHVHLIVVPRDEPALARVIGRLRPLPVGRPRKTARRKQVSWKRKGK